MWQKIQGFLRWRVCHNWDKIKLGKYAKYFAKKSKMHTPAYSDLWFLYSQVRKRKPLCVLELGTGFSTIIIAQALKDNGGGFLHSMEISEYFLKEFYKYFSPSSDYYKTYFSQLKKVDGGYVHTGKPKIDPDMIYLDSPGFEELREKDGKIITCYDGVGKTVSHPHVAIDPLEYNAKFVAVDGREANVDYLKKHMKNYKHTWRHLQFNSYFIRHSD